MLHPRGTLVERNDFNGDTERQYDCPQGRTIRLCPRDRMRHNVGRQC